jgi:adenylate cyclase
MHPFRPGGIPADTVETKKALMIRDPLKDTPPQVRTSRFRRRLLLGFTVLFGAPLLGILWLVAAHRLHEHQSTVYFLLGLTLCGLVGFRLLRGLLERFGQVSVQLERRRTEISVLKEFSELCAVSSGPEEVLHVALERALALTGSDLGSVLALTETEPRVFVVRASIGLGGIVVPGDRINYDTSIAKHAVENKTALVVADIATDKRFGRASRAHYGSASFVCLPIKTSRKITGVLTLSSRDPRRVYTVQDIEPLAALLANAAFGHENHGLWRAHDRNRAGLRSIEKIAAILGSSLRDAELVPAVLNELRGLLPFEKAAVFVRAENRAGSVQVKALAGGGGSGLRRRTHFALAGTLVEQTLRHAVFRVVDGIGPAAPELDRLLMAEGAAAGAGCCLAPLKAGGAAFGVLAVCGPGREALIEAEDFLNWVAGGLGLAVERNRLLAAVRRREQEMDTLRQVGSALASSTFDIGKVLAYTLDMIREVMNVEAGALLFLEGEVLTPAVAFHGGAAAPGRAPVRLGHGLCGHVAARGEALVVNDPQKCPHALPGGGEGVGFQTRSALCVPMVSQGRVIGVIEVLNKVGGLFEANDRDLLQSIAASVCIALENARLYRETVAAAEHERELRGMFQKFVPTEVIDRILHGQQGGRPGLEELKTVTLLNIDIRGFSAHARRAGPRRTVTMLNIFFSAMGEIVFQHGGIVDKYLGDGFLAVFGAPASGDRDADQAVDAAREMTRALGAVNRRLGAELGLAVETGISVHTGEVLAGNIGFDKKMDYTVIGDAVNTVFRLQALARGYPNGVLISERTREAVRARLEVQAVPTPEAAGRGLDGLKVFVLLGAEGLPAAGPGRATSGLDPAPAPRPAEPPPERVR